tara:strand:+ start:79 stop:486 length:408 start_codon:yes stop_codon:yes gene_type:complete
MTLKELKKMIAEEYGAFMKEQTMPAVSVADDDVDASGNDENAEETLKDIFDMLKDYFEGGDAPDAPEAEEEEEEKEDMEEGMGMYDEDEKDMKKEGMGMYDEDEKEMKKESKHSSKKVIAESAFKARFKKLANIK